MLHFKFFIISKQKTAHHKVDRKVKLFLVGLPADVLYGHITASPHIGENGNITPLVCIDEHPVSLVCNDRSHLHDLLRSNNLLAMLLASPAVHCFSNSPCGKDVNRLDIGCRLGLSEHILFLLQ